MNGDVGKLPSGAVYPATPEPLAAPTTLPTSAVPLSTTDYSLLNGVVDQLEGYTDASPPGGGPPSFPTTDAPLLDSASPTTQPSTPHLPLDQLKQMLSSQLEYYFSRENLANDTYLLSQMDNDQYVPIWTVANFNQVKKLTKDIKLITEVLRESPNVQVDEEGQKVRPNHKRCIVILREIPDSTPLEEIKGLFSGKGCPRLISCEFAHNNSWYVTFENDEDAQRAYRFLREEVRQFQGKPIMARIKAKPMNRLPIPAVSPGIVPGMKNGYRSPPAAPPTATVYDPVTAFPPTQQRFIYANGTSIQPTVNYGNQVQIYTFQQHQPFYPPSMLPPWGTTSPAYLDIGSVFSVNGLAPQASFTKTARSNFIPRNNRSKRGQVGGESHRSSMSDTGLLRHHHMGGGGGAMLGLMKGPPSLRLPPDQPKPHHYHPGPDIDHMVRAAVYPDMDEASVFRQPLIATKDSLPPSYRRRRKEEESVGRLAESLGPAGGGQQRLGPLFDLEADSFPPLPGLELSQMPPPPPVIVPATTVVVPPPDHQLPNDNASPPQQSQWENRLSDVVKGVVKGKGGGSCCSGNSTKDKESGGGVTAPFPISLSPRSATPTLPSQVQLPTPPSTPDKSVPVACGKCCTGDKPTKTEDATAHCVTLAVDAFELTPAVATVSEKVPAPAVRTTTNAATMTDGTAPPLSPVPLVSDGSGNGSNLVSSSGGMVRLSYAQVAQHHKEKAEREREKQQAAQTNTPAPPLPGPEADDKKENTTPNTTMYYPHQHRGDSLSRGLLRQQGTQGERGGLRRRDREFPRYTPRPRSPK